jgi:hypothetical protein
MSIVEEYQKMLNMEHSKKIVEQPAVVEAGNFQTTNGDNNFEMIIVRTTSPVLTINKDAVI